MMRRTFAAAVIVALLAPAAALAAVVGGMPGCCAGGETRVNAPMDCCETSMCAAPAPARQPKAVDAHPAPVVIAQLEMVDIVAAGRHPETTEESASPPPPTRIRLALVSTLLI